MKFKRRTAIAFAFLCAAGAAGLVLTQTTPPAPPAAVGQSLQPPPPPVTIVRTEKQPTKEILVAAQRMTPGQRLSGESVRWQTWPADSVPEGSIVRSDNPGAIDSLKGAVARSDIVAGEPINSRRAMRIGDSGFLASVLQPGMRAMAVPVDPRGSRTAGGLIAPNDRVDVILTQTDPKNATAPVSRPILHNIRVLAIGQQMSEFAGQPSSAPQQSPGAPPNPAAAAAAAAAAAGQRPYLSDTATLEVGAEQALELAAAIEAGKLSLLLRATADETSRLATDPQSKAAVTIVRFGSMKNGGQ